jgi:hypothetical protein
LTTCWLRKRLDGIGIDLSTTNLPNREIFFLLSTRDSPLFPVLPSAQQQPSWQIDSSMQCTDLAQLLKRQNSYVSQMFHQSYRFNLFYFFFPKPCPLFCFDAHIFGSEHEIGVEWNGLGYWSGQPERFTEIGDSLRR